jgi:hypothetical protein
MAEARNVTAIKRWVAENRPDMVSQIDQIVNDIGPRGAAFTLLMATSFEAGRMFQATEVAHPDRYIPMQEVY